MTSHNNNSIPIYICYLLIWQLRNTEIFYIWSRTRWWSDIFKKWQ